MFIRCLTVLPVLEIKRRGDPTEGSNPSFSAKPIKHLKKPFVIERLFSYSVVSLTGR